jgi:hypothetical protein
VTVIEIERAPEPAMAALATIPEQRGTALVFYDAMCRAIDAAYEVDEVKDIATGRRLEHYCRQAHNVEAERQCCEIRLRAERKAGEVLRQIEKAKGAQGNPGGRGAPIVPSSRMTAQKTLSDLGITRNQSSQWQKGGWTRHRFPHLSLPLPRRRVNHDRGDQRGLLTSQHERVGTGGSSPSMRRARRSASAKALPG